MHYELEQGLALQRRARWRESLAPLGAALKAATRRAPAQLGPSCVAMVDSFAALGRWDLAERALEDAVRSSPDDARLRARLAETRLRTGKVDAAREILESLAAGGDAHSAVRLGDLALDAGDDAAARAAFERAGPAGALAAAVALPMVYDDAAHAAASRTRVLAALDALEREPPAAPVCRPPFLLPYAGLDDREANTRLAALVARTRPDLCVDRTRTRPRARTRRTRPGAAPAAGAGRLRVGFVSSFFSNHTIGKLTAGLLQQLDRKRFDVRAFALCPRQDEVAAFIEAHTERWIALSDDVAHARDVLADAELDVLVFPDIGMDPATYELAFARLAPVQCAMWGHPVTTGIPTVDYFLSADTIEPEGAEASFTESLVHLPRLPAYYFRPSPQQRSGRDAFSLPADAHLYVCPQTLFKFHPDFDPILRDILRRDPAGLLVVIEGTHRRWTDALRARWRRAMPDVVDRVRVLPRLKPPQFFGLLEVADLLLDTRPFGGGNSTYEALAVGTPVVTWPDAFTRGRVTLGCYRQMGMDAPYAACVVDGAEPYAAAAHRLATDRAWRAEVSASIRARSGALFEDAAAVRAIERFFESAAHAAQRP